MNQVFVLDTNKHTCDPVHPACARRLLKTGEAAVFRRFPFTIILKVAVIEAQTQSYRLKIDPGSKTTGIAILSEETGQVVFAAELAHRGQRIRDALAKDAAASMRPGGRYMSDCVRLAFPSRLGAVGSRSTIAHGGGCPNDTGWMRPVLE